jgi:hypothetical protein
MKDIKLLDTVAILNSVPRERLTLVELDYEAVPSLPGGQVGTVVEVYEKGSHYQYLGLAEKVRGQQEKDN